jgi:hypothetical protein
MPIPDFQNLMQKFFVQALRDHPDAAATLGSRTRRRYLAGHIPAQMAWLLHITATSLRGYMKRKSRKSSRQATKARANNEGSVYEALRGSGIWYAVITIREGRKRRRIKRRAKSQKDAVRFLEELRLQHHNNIVAEPEPATTHRAAATITYRELFEEWINAVRTSLKESTLRHYQLRKPALLPRCSRR